MRTIRTAFAIGCLSAVIGCIQPNWAYKYTDEEVIVVDGIEYVVAQEWGKITNAARPKWERIGMAIQINGIWVECGDTVDTCEMVARHIQALDRIDPPPEDTGTPPIVVPDPGGGGGGGGAGAGGHGGLTD